MRERIAPGIWRDANGDIHWSIPELLEMVELEDTPENRARVEKMLEDLMRKEHPEAKIIKRPHPPKL
jgi:rhamnogalacturonyl hydrolase YesR